MTAYEELYRQLWEQSGVSDLQQALPADVEELMTRLGLDAANPSAYTDLSAGQVAALVGELLAQQGAAPRQSLGVLLGVILLTALLGGLEGSAVSPLQRTYHSVGVLGAVSVVLLPLAALVQTVSETAERVIVFLSAYVPLYAAVLVTGGRGLGAVSYQTTLLGAGYVLSAFIGRGVLPLLTVSLALGCVGAVTEGFSLEALSRTFHKGVLWGLGLFSTVFSGLLSIQQMVAAAADSLGGRVIRFSLSGMVPVVGGLLGEAYNTVMGCAGLLRTTMGAFGLLAVVLMVAPPLVRCVCWQVVLSLGGGAAELFDLPPLAKVCRTAVGAVQVLEAVLAAYGLMMIVATAAVVSAAGR